MKGFLVFGLCVGAFFCAEAGVFASTGEVYGYGSRAAALGNTMLGGVQDGYATFYNPAANSANPGFHLSIGLDYAHPSFLEADGIVTSNTATSSNGVQTGDDKNDDYLDHIGQTLGASLNLGESLHYFTVGVVASLPVTRLAYLDTGEAFQPEYFGYRSRTQRPQVYLSFSGKLLEKLYLGAGIAISTNLSGNTTLHASSTTSAVSYQRFSSTIKPGAAPYFSLYGTPDPWAWGVTARLRNRYTLSIDTNADARLFGPTAGIPLVTNSSSTLYYDPMEIDVGGGWHSDPDTFWTLEVDFFQYSQFESPVITVVNTGGATVYPSISSLPSMRNIYVPKFGVEHDFGKLKGRFGYAYRESPVTDDSGPGNQVDPGKHMFSAGVGFDLKKYGLTAANMQLDLHAQYHLLVTQHVTKSPGNEAGDLTEQKVGYPGYDIGGSIYSAGLSLSMAF